MKQEIQTRTGSIRVYDDTFTRFYREQIYNFVKKSLFQIGNADGGLPEYQRNHFLQSAYSEADVEKLGILPALNDTKIADEIKGRQLVRTLVNLSMPSDTYFAHIHPEEVVLLYYANLEWQESWHGETMFFNDAQDEVVYSSIYKPGRIIIFNGRIPHAVRPPSASAPMYRFTLAMNFA